MRMGGEASDPSASLFPLATCLLCGERLCEALVVGNYIGKTLWKHQMNHCGILGEQ